MAIDTIKFKRGVKSKLNNLSYGEPAYISDENELYIGTENGVEKITRNKEVAELSSQLEHIVVNVKDFGTIGDGISDDTQFVKNAIDYAKSINSINIKFPQGDYLIRELNIDTSINLIFENSSIIRPETTYSILFDYHSSIIKNVNQITNDGIKTKLFVDDVSSISRGDIVKVYSDDLVPNVRYESRNGEFKTVFDVGSDYISLSGLLDNTYTNNIKCVKVTEHKLNIKGATLKAMNNDIGESTLPVIKVIGGKYHQLDNIVIDNVSDTGVKMVGCYGYDANISSKYQSNGETYEEDVFKIGYGILDIAGDSYNIRFNSNNCRHPFDTNQGGELSYLYGEACGVSRNGHIDNSFSIGGSYSGISTHEDSCCINFNNVTVKDSIRYGAILRGENNLIQNANIEGRDGLSAGNYIGSASTLTKNVGNHIIRNTKIKARDIALLGNGQSVKSKIFFYNCEIEGKILLTNFYAEFNNCKLDIKDTEITDTNLVFNNCTIIKNGGFSCTNSSIEFNYSKIYPVQSDLLHPKGIGSVNINFNNSLIDWCKCASTSRNAIFGVYDAQTELDLCVNWLNTSFIPSDLIQDMYIGYIGVDIKSCTIKGFGTFVYPKSNSFKKEPWDGRVTIQDISYLPASLQLT